VVRAKASIETGKNDRQSIVVTEIPYQVNKASLIEKIADLINEKKLEDIADIRDESDRDGLRIVIDLKRDTNADVILNNLYKHTQMQSTFGVIMLALVDGRPKILTLKEMIRRFVDHRNEVVVRRSKFELDESEKRAHILEGYIIALDNIDAIVKLIRGSKDVETAKTGLMKKFKLSEIQAKAILDMRLQRLTGLERKKIEDEYRETIKLIERLKAILKSKQLQMEIIKEELLEVRKNYGDERRTEIVYTAEEFSIEDMIAEEQVVITISHGGFIKRFPVSGYRRQTRGGRGSTGATTKEDDFIEHMFVASTHDYIMLFTNEGRCYWLKVFEIPEGGRATRGKSIANLISKEQADSIASYVAVKNFEDPLFVMMVTGQGMIKKTPLSEFSNPRRTGIGAIGLGKGDRLIDVRFTDGSQDVVIGTHDGLAIRFHEQEARPMGRTAGGVRAIKLAKKDRVIGAVALRRTGTTILVATEKGFGKRSETDEYRVSHRGGKGIFTVKTTEKTGRMVAMREVLESDDIVVVTSGGIVIRQHASEVRLAGRNTQGVRLIKLGEGDTVSDVASVMAEDQEIPEAGGKKEGETPADEKKNLIRKTSNGKNNVTAKGRAGERPPAPVPAAENKKSPTPREAGGGKKRAKETAGKEGRKPKSPRRPSPKAKSSARGDRKKRPKRT
jgi:DNA gyrase subunit A